MKEEEEEGYGDYVRKGEKKVAMAAYFHHSVVAPALPPPLPQVLCLR